MRCLKREDEGKGGGLFASAWQTAAARESSPLGFPTANPNF